MNRALASLLVSALFAALSACPGLEPGPEPTPDGSVADAATPDAGAADAGETDSGATPGMDAGRADSGVPDAGPTPKDAGVDAGPPLPACPTFTARVQTGALESAEMEETSGLVVSRKNPGVLWGHNDSGDSARVFAFTPAGKLLGIYTVAGAQFRDWEDLAVAELNGEWYLVVGDIGGNAGRHAVQVYWVPEPVVSLTQVPTTPRSLSVTYALNLTYPGVEEHNAESLFVDPASKALYIVVKATSGLSPVFRKAPPYVDGSDSALETVTALNFAQAPLGGFTTTAADLSPDGRELVIKTYTTTYLWRWLPGTTLQAALATPPCPLPPAPGEAIAFSPDGKSLYAVPEGVGASVFRLDRK